MATRLTKPVVRETSAVYQGRKIMVALQPAGTFPHGCVAIDAVTFWLKGTRKKFPLPIVAGFARAAEFNAPTKAEVKRCRKVSRGLLRRRGTA